MPNASNELMQRADVAWSRREATHLLWRTGFGASAAEIQQTTEAGLDKTLDRLLTPQPESAEFAKSDSLLKQAALDSGSILDLKSWWLHRMVASANPLVEKLTLLWHNHFATSNAKVASVPLMAAQNDLLRRESLGSFRRVLHGIARDVAMLVWLDSNSNRKRHPNENFAREVMELFSLGVGNYSEHDIQEAARAFTGWHVHNGEFWFNAIQHDTEAKEVFGQRGSFDGGDVVELCLEHPACPRFLAFKLLRQFVEPSPSKEHLDALAARIRQHNFEWRPILRELFSSRLFFSSEARQSIIKSPVELLLGAVRQLGAKPNLQNIARLSAELGQDLFEPPTVKGWDGGRLWISSTTLIQRANFATALLKSNQLGSVSFAGLRVEDEVNYFFELLLARDAEPDVIAELREFLRTQTGDAEQRRRSLVQLVMQMPEYQLS
ncbi:MAG TPA: DUF1800 domain-containing protein [Planctomycetaceae bacterium]|nr:DUF1800 domain-containing protein [Planctomycetaceae bacterium]